MHTIYNHLIIKYIKQNQKPIMAYMTCDIIERDAY